MEVWGGSYRAGVIRRYGLAAERSPMRAQCACSRAAQFRGQPADRDWPWSCCFGRWRFSRKLISLQVVQHAKYAAIARSQQEHEIDIPAPRGSIFDRNGQPLAISVPVASVSVNPQQIQNLRRCHRGSRQHAESRSAGALQPSRHGRAQNHKGFMWVKRQNRSVRDRPPEGDASRLDHIPHREPAPLSERRDGVPRSGRRL